MWLRKGKVTEKKEMQMVQPGWGDQSLNLLLQGTLTIFIFNPATDKWMDTAPQGFCQGSCDPVDCMPIEKRYCPYFSVSLRELGCRGQKKKTHRCCSVCSFFFFFFNGEEKYLFSNLDSFFVQFESICSLLLSHFFFSFLFTQYPKQMLTHLTMLCTTRWRERGSKKLNWCLFLQSVSNVGLLD